MICPNCEALRPEAANFCASCGYQFRGIFGADEPARRPRWEYTEIVVPLGISGVLDRENPTAEQVDRFDERIIETLRQLGREGWYEAGPTDWATLWRSHRIKWEEQQPLPGVRSSSYKSATIRVKRPILVTESSLGGPTAPILVVDDDPHVLEAIRWTLESEGLPVETATDGRQALKRAAQRRPSLVVLDLSLPGLDGDTVAASLQAIHDDNVPILVISADRHTSERAQSLGAFQFLRKPFGMDDLVLAIRGRLEAG
ncbi:MAG: response regulator [Chloroflexi bacterium]|nr:response regulator [Chloroflexota bacterium]